MTERRRFIATAGVMAAAAAGAIVDAPNVVAQPKVQWRMSTAWTPALDVNQGAAERLAKVVEEMSGGRFRIEAFPGGQIMPPFACFEAASQGTIEAFIRVAGVLEELIELEEVGRLTLKGFLRPVPTFNALGLRTPAP